MEPPVRPRRRIVSNQAEGAMTSTYAIGAKNAQVEGSQTDLAVQVDKVPADPAYVSVGLGLTENLGNYESLRLDVRVTLPCGTTDEEVRAAAKHAGLLATEFIEDERKKALGIEGITS